MVAAWQWLTRGLLMCALAALCFESGQAQTPRLIEQDPFEALQQSVAGMTPAELEDLLFHPPPLPEADLNGARRRAAMELARDYVLSEMLRRDKAWSVPVLQKAVSRLRPKSTVRLKLALPKNPVTDPLILTALRRAEGAADPLQIAFQPELGPVLKVARERLPELKLRVKNVETKETLQLRQYDPSNFRWLVVLTNEKGEQTPAQGDLFRTRAVFGGGLLAQSLKPGETWDVTLSARDQLVPPRPGKYRLQVQFHPEHRLTSVKDRSQLILTSSPTIDVVIEKTQLLVTADEAAAAAELVEQLDGDAPLKIVAGTYGTWAHNFLPADSPAGKLLTLGAPAVPTLIELAQDKKLTTSKRAWLLALLFSITGEHDPRTPFVLGSYSYVTGAWEIWTEKKPERAATNRGTGTGSRSGGELDDQKLRELAAEWKTWLAENCEVKPE